MGHDKTPPRSNFLLITGFVCVLVLAFLEFVFQSYFTYETDSETFEKVASVPYSELHAYRRNEARKLERYGVPIEQAMKRLAGGDRAALPIIAPADSEDLGAIEGWMLTPDKAAAARAKRQLDAAKARAAGGPAGAEGEPFEDEPGDGDVPFGQGVLPADPNAAPGTSPAGAAGQAADDQDARGAVAPQGDATSPATTRQQDATAPRARPPEGMRPSPAEAPTKAPRPGAGLPAGGTKPTTPTQPPAAKEPASAGQGGTEAP